MMRTGLEHWLNSLGQIWASVLGSFNAALL